MLTAGLGLKPAHFAEALADTSAGLWFELHPENHLVDGGPRLAWLQAVGERHPLSLHGVSMSLAGFDRPDPSHLLRLSALVQQLNPALVSEHLAWCTWGGQVLPDLLPFVRDDAALARTATHIDEAQQALGRRIAIENPSHYITLPGHTWREPDFMNELVRRTGCGLLLDVNNVYVSAHNLGFDAARMLRAYDADAVMEIHLAGHHADPQLGAQLLIDGHDTPVSEAVWQLYADLITDIGPRPTLIERDDQLPDFATLMRERNRAHALLLANEVPA
ncbi:DUF692 domain-containing protein [Hydrogenophaga defluvii]|uniref:DUF692 domain-containing protein n=1 Tax=Hydrogenophaga defluvii TaxID=249410 RepID=A0ABW2SDS7_9BURK